MSLRRPESRSFSISLGALVAFVGLLVRPSPWPTDLWPSLAVTVCIGVLGWAAFEQILGALDWIVLSRLHWPASILGAIAVVGIYSPLVRGGPPLDSGLGIRFVFVVLAIFVVAVAGEGRRGALLLERERVRAEVTAVGSRRQELALAAAISVTVLLSLSLLTDGNVSMGTVVGGAIGTTIGSAFHGRDNYTLVALDDYLLIQRADSSAGAILPWRRLRDVSVDGDTLRVARGLPFPVVYTVDLSNVNDRHAVLEAFRSYPYLH